MAFEGLSDKLQAAFKKLTGKGKLNEQNIKDAMREVRMALLEADVNYVVVKDFIKRVSERCIGTEILSSLNAGQQVIKIVNEELTALMGGSNAKLTWSSSVPTIYMLCGLQGAGKTTMCGKLANYLVKEGKKPLLAACDIYRPAAIRQLQVERVLARRRFSIFCRATFRMTSASSPSRMPPNFDFSSRMSCDWRPAHQTSREGGRSRFATSSRTACVCAPIASSSASVVAERHLICCRP